MAHTCPTDPKASTRWPPPQPRGLHGPLPDRILPGTQALHHLLPRLLGRRHRALLLRHRQLSVMAHV